MKKIGITGQSGFIGKHLFNTLGLFPGKFETIGFNNFFFEKEDILDAFVAKCDVIVHLAGVNRHNEPDVIYNTNVDLTKKLISSFKRTNSKAHIIFSSSTQEDKDNMYGKSKKEARALLNDWANDNNGSFTGMIIPNVFGSFGNPYYNSVVATFCHQLTNGEATKIDVDGELKLIYVGELVGEMIRVINEKRAVFSYEVPHTSVVKVSEILKLLEGYKIDYLQSGIIPAINNTFELNLFNTFRSYIDVKKRYPIKFANYSDVRGSFSEIIRLNIGGQVSFSTTFPGTTRGNHFHTRKIERFAVIKGKALIQLRRISTDEVMDFYLSGDEPSYVDMPIWYTHNIKNIGNDELYTIFWINEFYNSEDPDTYFETV
ncbi:MAG: NAD-dependent epimerase/dehydratase family protein [Chitinophagaceae bacterium]|nr:NAD-dependent epimerase/dehydratase family protein [Chitinophagaceae bacterium]